MEVSTTTLPVQRVVPSRSSWRMGLCVLLMLGLMAICLCAEDRIFLLGANQANIGTIVKVDDTFVYLRLKNGGVVGLPRARITQVEITRPPSVPKGLKAWREGQAVETIRLLEPVYQLYRGLPQDWIEEMSVRLGEAYVASKEWPKAGALLSGFLRHYPRSRFRDTVLAGEAESLYARKMTEKALPLFEELVSRREKELWLPKEQSCAMGRACLRSGQIYASQGKTAKALERLLMTTTIYYQDPKAVAEALYASALAFEQLKNSRRVRVQLEELIREFPDSPFTEKARKKIETLPPPPAAK